MEKMKIVDCIPNGIVTLPPSKSLFHRALICAALAGEGSIIEAGGIISEDVEATALELWDFNIVMRAIGLR